MAASHNLSEYCYKPSDSILHARVLQYSLYVVTGSVAAFFNGAIVLAILKYKALRDMKDYIIIGGLSAADAILGLGNVVGGLYRLGMLRAGWAFCKIPRIWCMFTPQMFLWRFGYFAGHAMLLVVSTDRLITVAKPLKYLSARYARRFVGRVYFVSLLFYAAHWVHPLQTASEPVSAYCGTSSILHRRFNAFEGSLITIITTLSVFLYGFVLIIFHKHNNLNSNQNEETLERIKFARRMTVTLGISCGATIALVSVPNAFYFALNNSQMLAGYFPMAKEFSSYLWILIQINSVANYFIYGLRQREMKAALMGLVTCKDMPDHVGNWNLANTPYNTRRNTN